MVLIFLWQGTHCVDGFTLYDRPGFGLGPNPFQPSGARTHYHPYGGSGQHVESFHVNVIRPTDVPHDEFCTMTNGAQRQLPHKNGIQIVEDDRSELHIGFWQSRFKVGKYGAIHGLEYTKKPNGETKTPKTDQNTLEMMQSIENMAKDGLKKERIKVARIVGLTQFTFMTKKNG